MQNPSITTTELWISKLREVLDGEVITPDDDSYDEARHVFYGIDRKPACDHPSNRSRRGGVRRLRCT